MDNNRKITVQKKSRILHAIIVAAVIFVVFISLPVLCQSHSESVETSSFKYSREANEASHHDHYHDHDHHDHGHHGKEKKPTRKIPLDMARIWIHSIGSTLIISAAPFLLLYVIPLDNSESMRPRLKILLAFASGGLLGDAFLHLIPHASHSHSHDHRHDEHDDHSHSHDDHDHSGHTHTHGMAIGMWILGGIIAFLVVDKLVRILKGSSGHGHGHSHGGKSKESEKEISSASENESEDEKALISSAQENNTDKKNKKQINKKDNSKKMAATKIEENDVEISGYLNLAADFAHNFTDGLAIGASYLAGNSIGIITTVTILLHEVPHEIGDFAILIKAGCTKKKAMMLQLVTAIGALAGTSLALFGAADSDVTPTWVMPFTAGGFIYIATVSVLPELLEGSTKLVQSLKEIAALLAGVGIMIFIAMYE